MQSNEANYPTKISGINNVFRKGFIDSLQHIERGEIVLKDAQGTHYLGDGSAEDALRVNVVVNDPAFYKTLALDGSVGAGEAYMNGLWSTDNLTALVQLLLRNREMLDQMDSGLHRIGQWLLKTWHRFNKNSLAGSKKNIAAHYDLSNEFFELFLDSNMMYSSAIYSTQANTLEAASRLKLDQICRKLELSPADRLIEIGTGWGGFAIHAAANYGCHVTTTTISNAQYEKAKQRIEAAGLSDRITLLKEDYRNLSGEYDKLVSIEMIEAVGDHFLGNYIEKCSSLLKPDGLALIQAITIEDYRYQQSLKSVDFIKRYIFPGSFIPSTTAILEQSAKHSDFRMINLEDIGYSYALTLRAWRERFFENIDKVKQLGFDDRFIRMWEYYLCYCEGGFLEKTISDVQLLFAKPQNRREQWLKS